MTKVVRFKRSVTATHVTGDGVYVLSERGSRTRLGGEALTSAFPLLDGSHTREAFESGLAVKLGRDAAAQVCRSLLESGHVVEVDPQVDSRAAGYWELHGLDGDATVRQVSGSRVGVLALGDGVPRPETEEAAQLGLGLTPYDDLTALTADLDAALRIVIVDDYERPELREINEWALRTGSSWMLVKSAGAVLWIGPIFTPGDTACYECLWTRLSAKGMTESYLRQRGALDGVFVESVTGLGSTRALAVSLALQAVSTWLGGTVTLDASGVWTNDRARHGDVVTLDTVTLQTTRHNLDRRPQCAACGDATLSARRLAAPVVPVSRAKSQTSDGGHRAVGPEEFVASYERFVSPITGPVSSLRKLRLAMPGLHVYTAGQNFAMPMRGVADLKAGLRSSSCGKGISDIQAKASALGEAIERYSGVFHGDELRRVGSVRSLGTDQVIEPNALHLYSDAQFRDRAQWNARPSHFHWVGDQLDPAREVEWTPLWSLTEQRQKWMPTATLYYAYRSDSHAYHGGSNSNGCAAGSSLEDAILQGFMELVERDATAIWWYNRTLHRQIDLSSFDDPYFAHWQRQYASLNRRTWVLDITTDLGIPTVVSVSYRIDKPAQDILLALGSHFDVRIAIGRALSEMNQFLPAVIDMPADGSGRYAFDDPCQTQWWSTATIESEPYLLPDETVPPATAADFTDSSTDDLCDDIEVARSRVEAAGMEMLVLDQTRVDIGLPVARVVVPGMRHFWPRYAPGRLYDVPVQLGLLDRPTAEADLNPIGMFL